MEAHQDAGGLTDVDRFERYARNIAARTVLPRDIDDAVQDGLLGAWRAEQKWRPDGGMALETWCYKAIGRAIIDANRTRSGWKRVCQAETQALIVEPTADSFDDPERRAVTADSIRRLRATLDNDDAELFDALISGVTARAYAEQVGVTESRICQRVARLRERLNRAIN